MSILGRRSVNRELEVKFILIRNNKIILDTDETNIHILQLKAIEDIIGECKKRSKKIEIF